MAVPEDSTIKVIFTASDSQMRVSAAATTSDTDSVNFDIPKSQVAMLTQKGDNLVDQDGKSYSINYLMILVRTSLGRGFSKPEVNRETNSPYFLQSFMAPSYAKEEIPSGKTRPRLFHQGRSRR